MELLPRQQVLIESIMQTLRDTYSLYGFTPLDTPIIEASEVLLAKGGGETEKQTAEPSWVASQHCSFKRTLF